MCGFGASLALMNWAIYQSFARIPLGVAVTIDTYIHTPGFPAAFATRILHTNPNNPVIPTDNPQPCRGDTIRGSVPRHSRLRRSS